MLMDSIPITTIIIANIVEFNRRAMRVGFAENELATWDAASADLNDMALFWSGDNKLVITPNPVDGLFLADICTLLGYENLQVICPSKRSFSICDDIADCQEIFHTLYETLKSPAPPQVITWGATKQFYGLLDRLHLTDRSSIAVEVPDYDKFWVALYLESKSGCREFCQGIQRQIPDLHMPEGFICSSKDLALDALAYFALQGRAFVLKANWGTGGFSMLRVTQSELDQDIDQLRQNLARRMRFDHYWDQCPVILEEFISVPSADWPRALTIDFLIAPDGNITLIGKGVMLMRRDCLYAGISTGRGALEASVEDRMEMIGHRVAQAMAEFGYKGWFDLDFVVDQNSQLYLTEINARRASPAHVFGIAQRLAGTEWATKCGLYANDHLPLQGACNPDYALIRESFFKFNDSHRNDGIIAVPTIVNSSLKRRTPYIGYVILAEEVRQAAHCASELENGIRESIGMTVHASKNM